jgi:hypothetical protein
MKRSWAFHSSIVFTYGSFNDDVNNLNYVALNGGQLMNWKGHGRKWSLPNLRSHPGICPEGLRKTTNLRTAGLLT